MRDASSALLTDLYQLTMAAGYFDAGKSQDRATFEMSIRRLPPQRNFVLAAGLAQAVDYLLHLRFTGEETSLHPKPAALRARGPRVLRDASGTTLHGRFCSPYRKARLFFRASLSLRCEPPSSKRSSPKHFCWPLWVFNRSSRPKLRAW